ncbi:hypothetical protein PENSPDRAFT_437359 [Peniophora sp. CONT]|nr:hypothetical protein PENSPDRAFT_437359 [Peniophora sp. CONT]
MSYACCDCERAFGSYDPLMQHCRNKGHDDSPYCLDCDRYFTSWASRDQHFRDAAVHREEEVWTGGGSLDYYNYYDEEEDDEDEDEDEDDREPYCHGCRRWFNDLNGLDQHLATRAVLILHHSAFDGQQHARSAHIVRRSADPRPRANMLIV